MDNADGPQSTASAVRAAGIVREGSKWVLLRGGPVMTIDEFCARVVATGMAMTVAHYLVAWALGKRGWRGPFLLTPPDRTMWVETETIEGYRIVTEPKSAANDVPTDYARDIMPEQEAAHAEWVDRARVIARKIAKAKGEVSSDDIWRECAPPSGADARVMGAVFAERGAWELVRYQRSERRVANHGRAISVWRIKSQEQRA